MEGFAASALTLVLAELDFTGRGGASQAMRAPAQEDRAEAPLLWRVEEALAALDEVREAFIDRGIGYDAALVTLELAVLLLDLGRTREVKRLALETAPIFKAQGVRREALATLKLFCQAAQKETLTAALARKFLADLRRA